MTQNPNHKAAAALLEWYAEMGVDEAVAPAPSDQFSWEAAEESAARAAKPAEDAPARRRPAAPAPAAGGAPSADEAIEAARRAAARCNDFATLEAAVMAFDGCPLKAGAKNTVFTDGVPGADLLVIGEAPGRDEDRLGKPFVGRAGALLDRMLASIGRSRGRDTLISNVLFWRPPANRTPTQIETAVCRPFVERLMELTAPKAVLIAGGAPLQALLGVTGIMRARGVWREIETAGGARIPALPSFHPAFLLRQPANKRLAWADLQSLDARLRQD